MTNDKMNRERLETILEESNLYYVQIGDSWATRCGEAEVKFAQIGSLVRATVLTGIIATEQNHPALRAMANHLEGWEYKIAGFDVPVNGEVSIFYDRQIGAQENPDGMACRLAHTVEKASEKLRRVAAGESPHSVCTPSGCDASELIRFMRSHGDISDLLDD